MAISVPNDALRDHAARLLGGRVRRQALALAFSESTAASAEVLVGGARVLPTDARGHRRGDVVRPRQSVRLPAGHRRGGVRRRARRQGGAGRLGQAGRRSAGLGSGAELSTALRASDGWRGRRLRRARDETSRAGRAARGGGPTHWNLSGSATSITARSSWSTVASVGSAVPGSRITSTTGGSTTSSSASPAPSSRSSSSSSWRASAGSAAGAGRPTLDVLFPSWRTGTTAVPAVVLHNAPGRYRPITDEIARLLESAARDARRRQSRTSPTAA